MDIKIVKIIRKGLFISLLHLGLSSCLSYKANTYVPLLNRCEILPVEISTTDSAVGYYFKKKYVHPKFLYDTAKIQFIKQNRKYAQINVYPSRLIKTDSLGIFSLYNFTTDKNLYKIVSLNGIRTKENSGSLSFFPVDLKLSTQDLFGQTVALKQRENYIICFSSVAHSNDVIVMQNDIQLYREIIGEDNIFIGLRDSEIINTSVSINGKKIFLKVK